MRQNFIRGVLMREFENTGISVMGRMYLLSVFVFVIVLEYAIAQDDRPSILCATRKSLVRVDLETQEHTDVVTHLKRSVAVDYHFVRRLVVWTDVETEKIYSSPFDGGEGSKKVLVEVCVTPDGVAVDWIHDNLYWTDAHKDLVGVARLLDGSLRKTLVDHDVHEPRAIVVHPELGLMFWTDWGSSPKIERSGMDGSQRIAIVTSRLRWPNGLALDLATRRLYWIDGSTQALSSSNYDGKDERTLIRSGTTPLRHPFALDILGDWLYWTEWSFERKGLYKVNKKTGHQDWAKLLGGKNWTTLMGLKVYDRSKQPPGINRCVNNGGCTHLCLPAPGDVTYSCACPDDILPSDNCSTIPIEPLLNSTHERHNQEEEEPVAASSFPAAAVIGIALGIVTLASAAIYIHRKFSRWIGQTTLTSQGWTGIDNPVYRDTTQHRVSFEKVADDADVHRPERTTGWLE